MRAYERLLNYVRVHTTSDETSGTHPSAEREFDLARQLVEEMKALGMEDAHVDEHCYVYGTLPATPGCVWAGKEQLEAAYTLPGAFKAYKKLLLTKLL